VGAKPFGLAVALAEEIAVMLVTRTLLSLGLALTLLAAGSTAQAAKEGKKKGHHGVHGVVLNVEKDKDKNSGTITVKVHHHKKKNTDAAPAAEVEKKFRITEATKFERVTGSKGAREHKPAMFADVQKGAHVLVIPAQDKPDEAGAVLLVEKGKKKKEKAE
jgi:hypothetical protein